MCSAALYIGRGARIFLLKYWCCDRDTDPVLHIHGQTDVYEKIVEDVIASMGKLSHDEGVDPKVMNDLKLVSRIASPPSFDIQRLCAPLTCRTASRVHGACRNACRDACRATSAIAGRKRHPVFPPIVSSLPIQPLMNSHTSRGGHGAAVARKAVTPWNCARSAASSRRCIILPAQPRP